MCSCESRSLEATGKCPHPCAPAFAGAQCEHPLHTPGHMLLPAPRLRSCLDFARHERLWNNVPAPAPFVLRPEGAEGAGSQAPLPFREGARGWGLFILDSPIGGNDGAISSFSGHLRASA